MQSVDYGEFSYQTGYRTDGRPGLVPQATEDYGLSSHYLVDQRSSGISMPPEDFTNSGRVLDGSNLPHMRGDATIRPNTGNSNQSAGDLLGSLQEITSFLRWFTIASTAAAIIWEGFAFPLRLFGEIVTNPSQVVLGGYLAFFCILVLSAEFNNQSLKDNFGVLFYPLSRGLFLLLMSGMCLGILQKWWESMLGLNFAVAGFGYIYAYIRYPEYRRWEHFNERMPTAWQEAKMYWAGETVNTAAWSSLPGADRVPMIPSETQTLLSV